MCFRRCNPGQWCAPRLEVLGHSERFILRVTSVPFSFFGSYHEVVFNCITVYIMRTWIVVAEIEILLASNSLIFPLIWYSLMIKLVFQEGVSNCLRHKVGVFVREEKSYYSLGRVFGTYLTFGG